MLPKRLKNIILVAVGFCLAAACTPTPKQYAPPGKTAWRPEGCRLVPPSSPLLGYPTTAFWRLHGDTFNSDEISTAAPPVFAYEGVVEGDKLFSEAPAFDKEGNIYLCPLWASEEVSLVSLRPDGTRRWAIPGFSNGAGAPVILNDPDHPGEQIVYHAVYDKAYAIKTDGTVLWEMPTGLPAIRAREDVGFEYHVWGVNYDAQADAIILVTGDAHVVALDRRTGAQLLAQPYQLPGALPLNKPLPDIIMNNMDKMDSQLMPLVFQPFPEGKSPFLMWAGAFSGRFVKVANTFSVNPSTGRILIAATAPDAEDGKADGISEFGAVYGLDLVENGSAYSIEEVFHRSFEGGSASTPSLGVDGSTVYVGDNDENLLAIDSATGETRWTLGVGAQIIVAPAVSSDNREVYIGTMLEVLKVVDHGTYGEVVWRAPLDMWTLPPAEKATNLLTVTVAANGIVVMAGAGIVVGNIPLPFKIGLLLIDRQTGQVRYGGEIREDSTGATTMGPDGSFYISCSPPRRLIAHVLFGPFAPEPVTGGVQIIRPERLDLHIRDAVCAAAARAGNAFSNAVTCPDSVAADILQIQVLIDQSRHSSVGAIADGDLTPSAWETLNEFLTLAEASLAPDTLDAAAAYLQQSCDFFPN